MKSDSLALNSKRTALFDAEEVQLLVHLSVFVVGTIKIQLHMPFHANHFSLSFFFLSFRPLFEALAEHHISISFVFLFKSPTVKQPTPI
jgi:hypothetical protein